MGEINKNRGIHFIKASHVIHMPRETMSRQFNDHLLIAVNGIAYKTNNYYITHKESRRRAKIVHTELGYDNDHLTHLLLYLDQAIIDSIPSQQPVAVVSHYYNVLTSCDP